MGCDQYTRYNDYRQCKSVAVVVADQAHPPSRDGAGMRIVNAANRVPRPRLETPMPDDPTPPTEKKPSKVMSRTALALGAAGLFLFIVGVKRKHRLDAEREIGEERDRRGATGD